MVPTSREKWTPPVRMDISTADIVETVRQQGDTLLDACNQEIDGIELAREGFLFAPPTGVTMREPDDILLPLTAHDLHRINPEDVKSY